MIFKSSAHTNIQGPCDEDCGNYKDSAHGTFLSIGVVSWGRIHIKDKHRQ